MAIVTLCVMICAVVAVISTYWIFFDRTPPIQDVTGRLISFDSKAEVPTAVFEYVAGQKNRWCPGERDSWQQELRDEPPPRSVNPLSPAVLPPEDWRGAAAPIGAATPWRVSVPFPRGTMTAPFGYGVEWVFYCNPAQHGRPIRVRGPLIEVHDQ